MEWQFQVDGNQLGVQTLGTFKAPPGLGLDQHRLSKTPFQTNLSGRNPLTSPISKGLLKTHCFNDFLTTAIKSSWFRASMRGGGGSARGYLVRSSTTTSDHSGTEWLGKGAGFQSSVVNCLLEYLKGNKQREDQLTEIARTFTSHPIPSFLRKRIFMSTHPGSAITLPTLHIPA